MTVQQAFALALAHHQAGRLAEAEVLYRQILAVQPLNPDAMHLVGVIAHQTGRHELAIQQIRQSIALNPHNPATQINLGEACRALGRLDEAVAAYQQALRLRPDHPDALYNLGNALRDLGKLEEAAAAYLGALHSRPDYAEASNNLASLLIEQRQFEEAIGHLRRALANKADFPQALNNLGSALVEQRKYDEAIGAFRRALELRPEFPEGLNNLGSALQAAGKTDEAVTAYQQALRLDPALLAAQDNLGDALKAQGRLEEAVMAYRRAIEIQPDHPKAYYKLGAAFVRLGQPGKAIAAYEAALKLRPAYAEALNNLGSVLREMGELDRAIEAYRRALELKPDLPEAHCNMAYALKDQGRPGEAIAAFRRALELAPDNPELHSELLLTMPLDPDVAAADLTKEEARWDQKFSWPLKASNAPHPNVRDADRRLRIGYVSADFRNHVVGRNLVPLISHHDHRNFEIVCYSGAKKLDDFTERFRQLADRWRESATATDEMLASQIRDDGIDILVDLAQHTSGNRLTVFARQPAPVQVSFAGYPAGTGLEAIGYRISDRWLESETRDRRWEIGDVEAGASEFGVRRSDFGVPARSEFPSPISDLRPAEQVFLIESFWCYDPCGVEVAINELPARESGRITFGSLNNFCKINDTVLALWARVLRETGESRLVLLSPVGSHRQRTREFLAERGVASQRVEFFEWRSRKAYLELYHGVDIVLDPFPYGGHTTSLDALWMGVPVVSLAGERAVSRAGLSILNNLGLPELVAFSEDAYVKIATGLAADLARLTEWRRTLRSRMEASVLMDAPGFARSIEEAYRAMWRQWCASGTS